MRHIPFIFLAVLVLAARTSAMNPSERSVEIVVGQTATEAVHALRKQSIEVKEAGFEETRVAVAADYESFVFDVTNDTLVRVHYSKLSDKVTGISLLMNVRAGKLYRQWLDAKCVRLEQDGSWTAHFLPPPKR